MLHVAVPVVFCVAYLTSIYMRAAAVPDALCVFLRWLLRFVGGGKGVLYRGDSQGARGDSESGAEKRLRAGHAALQLLAPAGKLAHSSAGYQRLKS